MTLKWAAVVVAAVSVTVCVTSNVLVGTLTGREVAAVLNMAAITLAGVATMIAVVAELHERVVARIGALSDLVVARLDELEMHTGDRNAGFVEGYLLGQTPDASVVPISPRARGRRAMNGLDD
ncbi:MAG TPA: hypothetical protein VHN18_02530 [Micromonosporaceae bacterium]|nr:hypothetical protein [Micromonosporaceae bacterium]